MARRLSDLAAFEYHEASISSGSTLAALSTSTLVGVSYRLKDADQMQHPREQSGCNLWSVSLDIEAENAQ